MSSLKTANLQEQFKRAFIAELPERIADLENRLRACERSADCRSRLVELYPVLQGIKGSAASFGLFILTGICNPLDEIIGNAVAEQSLPEEQLQIALGYAGLMREAHAEIVQGSEDFQRTEQLLAQLHERAFRHHFSVALAVNSRLLRDLCEKVAADFGARAVVFEDSVQALDRILAEPFHVVVASSELYPMRGEALIAALKLSHRRPQAMRTILVTSSSEKAEYVNRAVDPDCVIIRDRNFVPRMHDAIAAAHAARGGES